MVDHATVRRWLTLAIASSLVSVSAAALADNSRGHALHGGVGKPVPTDPFSPSDKLNYLGGRVISNVKVVEVSWGTSVDTAYLAKLADFYKMITVSPWIDSLTEYDTVGRVGYIDGKPGSNQHIGRGSYGGLVTLSSLQNNTTALADPDIQTEILYQLGNGGLPQPESDLWNNVNTIYMIDFPQGIGITLQNLHSCSNFGAYHGTLQYKGKSVPYGVHPFCGYGFDTATEIHSHELVEAITDAEVGLGIDQQTGRPVAWTDTSNGQESGDICNFVAASLNGYTVQKWWSNYAKACVASIPICDGSLMPPACRPCNKYDSGNACGGATPACALTGPNQGRCVACSSSDSKQCTGNTAVCDDSTSTCVGCLATEDCAGNTPVCEVAKKSCRGCAQDSECATGAFCDVSSDSMKGSCVACNLDAQCDPGLVCGKTTHTCAKPAPTPDASVPADAGGVAAAPADSGGCAIGGSPSPAGAFALLLALTFWKRKRR